MPVIDGCRGLAIILVVGYHYTSLFSFGWIGVDLFFVISGFLITGKLLESAGRKNYLSEFYIRRILRIVPLYLIVLLIFFVIIPVVFHAVVTNSVVALLQTQLYYWTFTINFFDAIHGWPLNITLVPLWSLACEMQFYLCWPFVVLALYRLQTKYILAVLMAFIFCAILFRLNGASLFGFDTNTYRYVLLPSRLDAFSCGALLAVCIKYKFHLQVVGKAWLLSIASLLAAGIIMLYQKTRWHFGDELVSGIGYTLNGFFWMGIIGWVWSARGSVAANVLNSKWLAVAGKYSYAMYIFHVPVKIILLKICRDAWWPGLPDYAMIIPAVAVTFGCSMVSYQLIEKRFLRLKDNFHKYPIPG